MKNSNEIRSVPGNTDCPTGTSGQPDLDRRLNRLLDDTFAEMMSTERRTDPMFGSHAATVALGHYAYGHEARLIERATILLCEGQEHLQVVQLDRAFPLVESAREALRGNDWSELEGIRLPSRVFAEETYMPDLVVIDRRTRDAFLFDIKRSVDNKLSRIRGLMEKLKAAALVAPDWLALRAKVRGVPGARIAILDASGEVNEPKAGVMPLAALEQVLAIRGFAAALASLRQRFSVRLQQELDGLQTETASGEYHGTGSGAVCGATGLGDGTVEPGDASDPHSLRSLSGGRVGYAILPPNEGDDGLSLSSARRH